MTSDCTVSILTFTAFPGGLGKKAACTLLDLAASFQSKNPPLFRLGRLCRTSLAGDQAELSGARNLGHSNLPKAGWEPIRCVRPDAADDEQPTSRRPARGQPRASAAKDSAKDMEAAERFVEDFHDRHENLA